MPTIHAVDLSHWNEVDSFDEAADSGLVGVLHKATEGVTFVDKTYAGRREKALDAGLKWGAYHFLKHDGKVQQQMEFFVKVAALEPGSRLAIDYEDPMCTLDDLHRAVSALGSADPTAQIAIYSGHLLKEQLAATHDAQLAECSLWLAQYTSGKPTWPKGTWEVYSLWQFTDGDVGGTPREVPGIRPPMDCNHFNGTAQACARWFGPVLEPDEVA